MEKTIDAAALGELLIDFTEGGFNADGKETFVLNPGGAPCNVLAMLSKLGKKTAFIGKVGNDKFGRTLKAVVEQVGIDASGVVFDNEVNTTLSFVYNEEDGERDFTFYRNPGADIMLDKADVDYNIIRKSRVFHFGTLSMSSEPVRGVTLEAIAAAKAAKCLVSFDPNVRIPLWRDLEYLKECARIGFADCDILKISDNEVTLLTNTNTVDEGIAYLIKNYQIPLILLTKGASGSCAYYNGSMIEQAGYKVKAVETTGAGDTFLGCVLSRLLTEDFADLSEEKLRAALDFANAAAAIVTTRQGAIMSMPTAGEIEKFRKANQSGTNSVK